MDRALETFVAVVEHGGFTHAANALHATQPAVSQQVRLLEQYLGVQLLERTTKRVRLNRAGEVVYYYAKQILQLQRQMERTVQELSGDVAGRMTIGASYTFGECVLPHLVARFLQRYPRVEPVIEIANTQRVMACVEAGTFDLGIVEGDVVPRDGLLVEPLATDAMVVVAAVNHPLCNVRPVSVEMLAETAWLIREPGSGTRFHQDRFLEQLGIVPRRIMSLGSTQVIKEGVEAGLGITLLSACAVRRELQHGSLCVLATPGTPVLRMFSVVTRRTQFEPAVVKVFRETLREQGAAWVKQLSQVQ
ncbi:MAG: LysR family transcriptional regulator [Thermoflavifilum sp.]|nr:LysR family transcriptional regulator [Thermoflavifilum sp.]MCL6514059.1 LysR family transcriptional regulator [Alicyclobacillus sp.]